MGRLLQAMTYGAANIARVMIVAIFLLVVYDVTVRSIGFNSPLWTTSLAEYGLLFSTLLAAPWLVRRKGHVFIKMLVTRFGPGLRRALEIVVTAVCIVTCLVLAYYSVRVAHGLYERGAFDIRSFAIPAWYVIAPFPFCFILMALEFGRFLLGYDTMLEGTDGATGL
jgi:TRAP-type C4-dicarboxylate transport system permease small subunit